MSKIPPATRIQGPTEPVPLTWMARLSPGSCLVPVGDVFISPIYDLWLIVNMKLP